MTAAPTTLPIYIEPSPADALGVQYARISLPLKKGDYPTAPAITVAAEDGAQLPVQSELLTHWPDGSVRVLHLTFPATAGVYQASLGTAAAPRPHPAAINAHQGADGRVEVNTGRLHARLGGAGLVESIRLGNAEMIGAGGIEVAVVAADKRAYKATLAPEVSTTLETSGPLRTVVALRGKCTLAESETFIDFRLRFEFLAGVEGFSLSYAFFNLERGADFFDVKSITLQLELAASAAPQHTVYQQSHGLFSTLGRVVTTTEPIHIAVDNAKATAYVSNFEALGDDIDYPFYLNPPCDRVPNWGVVSDGPRAMQVEMDDFHMLRPKTLKLEGNAARFGIWPKEAGTLSLQQGRSRQTTVRVALSDSGVPQSAEAAQRATAQLRDVWRAQLPGEVYGAAAFFDQGRVLPFDPGANPRFESWFQSCATQLSSVCTFFDLGDTPDTGYQSTYIPVGNRIKRVRGEDGGVRYFGTALHYPATSLNNLDDFEPVWVNNEYDVIFALGTEMLRSGDRSLFQKLGWFARHCIDVDFLHYSDHKWLNRAQPAHSERHTTTGAYPSHFWTQGLAQYYMLTADPDALEVIVALADKTIENLDDPILSEVCSGLNREIGWGILTMICAYEASGIKKFDAYARELIDREINHGLPHDIPVFSFGHTSILLGARQYLQIHEGDPAAAPVRQWFIDFVDIALGSSRAAPEDDGVKKSASYSYDADLNAKGKVFKQKARSGIFGPTSIALDPLAYAYEITGDEKYIRGGMRSIEAFLDSPSYRAPRHEGKPYAMTHRTFINFLKAASELGYLKEYEYRF